MHFELPKQGFGIPYSFWSPIIPGAACAQLADLHAVLSKAAWLFVFLPSCLLLLSRQL